MVKMGKKACRFGDFIDELMHGKFFAVIISECMRLFSIGSQGFQGICVIPGRMQDACNNL